MANYDLTYEGSRVQGILDTGNSLKDAGYIFRGEATPSTVPGTPTERVAYIGGPGTYTNFGSSITVGAGCICIFKYTGSAWSNQVINTGLDSAVNTLQSAITAINNNIGNGYVYAGVATPSTSPVTGKVFYLAVQAGTYTNFGNAVVTAGLNVLKKNGSAWSVDQVIAIDAKPTQGSANLVKSGGVLNSIIQNGPAFDLSAYNAQGGVLATYADLSAALTALNALPADFKKGGMSMKFVLSSDNKYVQYRLMADEFTTDTTQWAIAEEGVYVENPEFVRVILDNENKILEAIRANGTKLLPSGVEVNEKIYFEGNETTIIENPEFAEVKLDSTGHILWGIQKDGNVYFGAGVPQQVIDYINKKIAELSLDEYEDIVAFLNGLEEGDKTLQTLLDEKVDKVEGKSLIDAEYASSQSAIENPEFIEVITDSEDKVIEGIQRDGTKVIGGDVKVLGSININGINYKVVSNPEWFKVVLDAEDKIICGIRTDGTFCVVDLEFLDSAYETKNKLAFFDTAENPEFMEVELDADDKILGGRKVDGTKFENVGLDFGSAVVKCVDDPEDRMEVKADSDEKIISYRKEDGTLVENVGIETPSLKVTKSIELVGDAGKNIVSDIKASLNMPYMTKKFNLPDYGSIDIICELYYLGFDNKEYNPTKVTKLSKVYYVTASLVGSAGNYTIDSSSIPVIKINNVYYKVSTLGYITDQTTGKITGYDTTSAESVLDTDVTELSNIYYATSSLVEITEAGTGDFVRYDVGYNSTEQTYSVATTYTEIDVDMEDTTRWPVNKDKHYCKVAMKFGDIDGTWYATVAFQGASTLTRPKKGLRITPYKKSDFAKKYKIRIGEMIATSKFNVKAYYGDPTRLRDVVLQRLVIEARNLRNYPDQYPWNNDYPIFTGAVGTIQSFPVKLTTSGNFYGVSMMGLAKDEHNYMLDGDETGMFISGDYDGVAEHLTFAEFFPTTWSDEMNDVEEGEHTPSNLAALTAFWDWINNGEWNKTTVPQHMSVIDWIDYYIFVQVFRMRDNDIHNIILYTKADKVKFYAFMYDLDLSWGFGYNYDMPIDEERLILWKKFVTLYWDEIVERYKSLRSTILNYEHVSNIITSIQASIPYSDFEAEMEKWNEINYTNATKGMLNNFKSCLVHFDEFFK